MVDEEAFLFEVILAHVELKIPRERCDDKKPRFMVPEEPSELQLWLQETLDDKTFNLKETESCTVLKDTCNTMELMNQPKGRIVVAVKALHFPWFYIREDTSKYTDKEKREKKDLNRLWGKLNEMTREEEVARAHSVGLTLEEFREIQRSKPPAIKKRFKKGKSTLFYMNYQKLIELIKRDCIVLCMYHETDTKKTYIGRVAIRFTPEFIKAICAAHQSSVLRKMIELQGHVYYPPCHYARLKRERQPIQHDEKPREDYYSPAVLTKMEPYNKFVGLYNLEDERQPCPYCEAGCGCSSSGTPNCLQRGNMPQQNQPFSDFQIDCKIGELMEPSPDPVKPIPLPTTASIDGFKVLVNDECRESASLKVFIRLSCFGTSLYHKPISDECSLPNNIDYIEKDPLIPECEPKLPTCNEK